MLNNIEKIKEKILNELKNIKESQALADLEQKYLGRKGELTGVLRGVANLSAEDKRTIGKLANDIKEEIKAKLGEMRAVIDGQSNGKEVPDMTLPGISLETGHIHPISQLQADLEDLFVSMGFKVLDGPELESDYYNFEALNIPFYHPARDMQDTFYVDLPKETQSKEKGSIQKTDLVMRTHTSPMQVRAMQKYGAPLRCVIPGRVFRNEDIDACHDTTFDQIEGLMIGEDISLVNLLGVLKTMVAGIFQQDVKMRFRPGYFPFVEPGLEADMCCLICGGEGCPACKQSGWLEMVGAGMIHPNVIRAGGLDPEKYSGFAFGFGMTRLAMMKYGIDDIRLFNGGDLRFLRQF